MIAIGVERSEATVVITVRANAFLHHMVRNIAGALIAVGTGRRAVDWIAEVLASRRPAAGGVTAPPQGLYLAQWSTPTTFGVPPPVPDGPCPDARRRIDSRGHLGDAVTWFEKIMPSRIKTERRTRSVPEGLWIKCPACDAVLYRAELDRNLHVCPKCSHHMRIGARDRLDRFLDEDSARELAVEIEPEDPLKFRDSKRYRDRLQAAQKQTGEKDALVVMAGTLHGLPVVACAFEFRFLGGSMGSVVGERFVRGAEHCLEHRASLVCFSVQRRRAHAGRPAVAAADEQDERGAGADGRRAPSLRLGADRPDDRAVYRPASRCSATSTLPNRGR